MNSFFKRTLTQRESSGMRRAIARGAQPRAKHRLVRMAVAGAMVFAMVPAALTGCGSNNAASNTANNASATTSATVASSTTSSGASSIDLSAYDLEYTDRDGDASYDEASAVKIELSGASASASSTDGVSIDGSTVTISKEGVYVVSGSLSDGQIVVSCNKDDKAKVQIVLKGANISCSEGSAIYVEEAKKVFLTLADGTTNTISDGSDYTLGQDEGSANAAIYSKDNLTLQGSGTLNVTGNYADGIACKDELVITGGTYNVTAADDALRGKDAVKINGGTFNITAGGDAVKSTNADEEGKGFVAIDGGTFSISAGDDAVHSEYLTLVNDGNIDISTCYEGLEGQTIIVNGGTIRIVATDDGLNAASVGGSDMQMDDIGGPGMNHMQNIQDNGGTFDDARGGQAPGSAGATTASFSASATSSAAVQTAGGMGGGDMGGGGMMDGDSSCVLQINGGYLVVDAAGDGVDSNGSVEITGGVVLVAGPTSGGDGAFDYGLSANITGGTVIMAGSRQMAQSFSEGTQAFSLLSAGGSAGQNIAVVDASGNVLASFTTTKQFDCVVVSAPGMTSGTSYSLVVGGTVSGANSDGYASSGTVSGGSSYSFTAETSDTSNSMGGGMPSGMGGGMRDTATPQGDWGGGAGGDAPSGRMSYSA